MLSLSLYQIIIKVLRIIISTLIFFICFNLREILKYIYGVDVNEFWDILPIFVSVVSFNVFLLSPFSDDIELFMTKNFMNNQNIDVGQLVIGPEERNMGLYVQNQNIYNDRGRQVFFREWGYAKNVISNSINGPAHIFTHGNTNFDFNIVSTRKAICANFHKFLELEYQLRRSNTISSPMFTTSQKEFLAEALKHYYPNSYANLLSPQQWNARYPTKPFQLQLSSGPLLANSDILRRQLYNIKDMP